MYQAGAGIACRLPQRLAAAPVSGEKLLCTELWSSRDSLRGLVQAPDGLLIAIDAKESDVCWCSWLGGGGGVPACVKGEGKYDLWISKDKGGFGDDQ